MQNNLSNSCKGHWLFLGVPRESLMGQQNYHLRGAKWLLPLYLPCSDVLWCAHAHSSTHCGDSDFTEQCLGAPVVQGVVRQHQKGTHLEKGKLYPSVLGHTNPKEADLEAETHWALPESCIHLALSCDKVTKTCPGVRSWEEAISLLSVILAPVPSALYLPDWNTNASSLLLI